MEEFYYIKILHENPRRESIILTPKGEIKRFASKRSVELWLNKNKKDLTPGAIYTPIPGYVV